MDHVDALKRLKSSDEYRHFHKENPSHYLAHCFLMLGDADENWQIGFYDRDTDRMTTFYVRDAIEVKQDEEVFHKPETVVPELKLQDVKVGFGDALDKAKELQKEKYPQHVPTRKMIVLQTLEGSPHWNMTFLTSTFHTLNIKVDASTGKVTSHELTSFLQMGDILDKAR